MKRKRKLPLVAICGRPNVGKSTLFNRITGKHRAIVHSVEGVTRDRAYGEAEWAGRTFRVVDTGGIVEQPTDPITRKMQDQVRAALDEARVIVFVVDGQQELTRTDEEVRDELFRLGRPVVLAVNKLDNPNLAQLATDFYRLGLGEPYPVSATHGTGTGELLDAVAAHLPEAGGGPAASEDTGEDEAPVDDDSVTKVAVVGKPNVGKSSFINAILNQDRTIVDETPGTTRDAIDIEFHWKSKDYLLIDTAGMRKKAGVKEAVEHYSIRRALRAVRRADVCLVMVDAVSGISEQDKRIVNYVKEIGAGMVLVWTKWDLVGDPETRFKELAAEIDLKAPFLKYVPYVTISNITRKRLFTTFEYIDRVAEQVQRRIPTPELNRFFQSLRAESVPAMRKGRQAKILYATHAELRPSTFVLFVNQTRLFHFSYLRFIENRLREAFGFEGVPVRLELKEGKPHD